MISTVTLTFDLTASPPVGIVTDTTNYDALGIDLVLTKAKGLGIISFNGDEIVNKTNPNDNAQVMIDFENLGSNPQVFQFPLELDSNGNVANGVYTFQYSLRLKSSCDFISVTLPDTAVVDSGVFSPQYADFFEVGNILTMSPSLDPVSITSIGPLVGGEFTITLADLQNATDTSATFDITNVQFNGVFTYSGCTQTTADVSFTYDCEYGNSGSWAVSNTTVLASNEVIPSLSCTINYPGWTTLSPTFPGNVVTNSLPYPSLSTDVNPLATGTYTVSLTQQIHQIQTDGLILQYTTSTAQEFAVSCAGSLCGLTPCIENLRVAHADELQRNRISKYQVFVDNVLLYYAEAQNYRACGDTANYRATVDLIRANLDSSGCECACCDDSTYYWVSNNSATSVIDSIIESFQFRLFTLNPAAAGPPPDTADIAAGVQVGAIWENTTTKILYLCTANTAGNPTWVEFYDYQALVAAEDVSATGGTNLTANDVQGQLSQADALFTSIQADVVTLQGDVVTLQTDVSAIQTDALFTASNGLTKVVNDVQLGGTLDADVIIDVNESKLKFTGEDSTLEVIATSGTPLLLSVNQSASGLGTQIVLTTTNTGGFGANGIGSSIKFAAENSAGLEVNTATIKSTLVNATTNDSNLQLSTKLAGTESAGLTVNPDSSLTLNKYGQGDYEDSVLYTLGVDATGLVKEVAVQKITTYVAKITQASTGVPVLTVIHNDTGLTISAGRNAAGDYYLGSVGYSFDPLTTMVLISNGDIPLVTRDPIVVARVASSRIAIKTKFAAASTLQDDVLVDACIEIRIYE